MLTWKNLVCFQYIPRLMLPIYKEWGKRTTVTLSVDGKLWNVDILRNKKVCRFGKGWDRFTKDNSLIDGQELSFCFTGNLNFNVKI